ncbi:MAG TPA: Mrp/NBP35 family ATP-binding protein [Acidimicrobiales bacterium]|nr:Mrp/NBP35 family ATP-binding protein [Acidimicrobiales bacterium]
MTAIEDRIIKALEPVQDPELRRSIVELGMVQNVSIDGSKVEVLIALTIPGCPLKNQIKESIEQALNPIEEITEVGVEFTVMSDEQRESVRLMVHGDPQATAGTNPAQGHAEGREVPFGRPGSKTRVLLIASGKGGVGKSSLTANLAVALARRDRDVAVVDADVWGFSIPRMLGVQEPPTVIDDMLIPPVANGVRCISMGFFAEEDQPVIWRGPMLHKALEQFLTDVYWDNPDYLLVDLPPGTGDISISLAGFLPTAEMIVVTTPQPAAQKVAQRAAYMAEKVNVSVNGVIENMSWFTADDGARYQLFGEGGGQELADQLGVSLLGKVPLVPELREGADTGNPVAANPSTESGKVFEELARVIDEDLKPTRRSHPELNLLG